MAEIPLHHGLILAIILFSLGVIGLLVRRNVLFIMMSIEVMLNATGLAFVFGSARWGQPDGQIMFLLILTMTAAEVSVGLALVIQLFHRFKTLDIDQAISLREDYD